MVASAAAARVVSYSGLHLRSRAAAVAAPAAPAAAPTEHRNHRVDDIDSVASTSSAPSPSSLPSSALPARIADVAAAKGGGTDVPAVHSINQDGPASRPVDPATVAREAARLEALRLPLKAGLDALISQVCG